MNACFGERAWAPAAILGNEAPAAQRLQEVQELQQRVPQCPSSLLLTQLQGLRRSTTLHASCLLPPGLPGSSESLATPSHAFKCRSQIKLFLLESLDCTNKFSIIRTTRTESLGSLAAPGPDWLLASPTESGQSSSGLSPSCSAAPKPPALMSKARTNALSSAGAKVRCHRPICWAPLSRP